MPEGVPIPKAEATRSYGGEVALAPGNYVDATAEVARLAKEEGLTFAHLFAGPFVIAGQGTLGLEILEQAPDVEQIVVPVGGGGLATGVAVAVKSIHPNVKVIGVQAPSIPSMSVSVTSSEVTTIKDGPTNANGIHVPTPGNMTFDLVSRYVDDVVTVTEDEIAAVIVALLEGPKTMAEGAGASSAAADLFGRVDTPLKAVALVSGGNVDITTLAWIIIRGMQQTGRIARQATKFVDKADNLAKLVQLVTDDGANVLEIYQGKTRRRRSIPARLERVLR